MQNLDSKTKTYPISKTVDIRVITEEKTSNNTKVLITFLTPKEELHIDTHGEITIKRDNLEYRIQKHDIYCYGDVDFNANSDDIKIIDNFDFLNGRLPFYIYSNYDYLDNVVIVANGKLLYYETWDSIKVVKYLHGYLGKPKKIIIFKAYK